MKQKFTVLDVCALVNELKEILVNKYISNIYSKKQQYFYFKFSSKDMLTVEVGAQMHLSSYHESEINHFTKKLREYIRNFRVVDIYQFSYDRIIVFDLLKYKIVFEFFSLGNVILLDTSDIILDVHRPIPHLEIVKGKKYLWNNTVIDFTKSLQENSEEMFLQSLPFETSYGEYLLSLFKKENQINSEDIKTKSLEGKFNDFVKTSFKKLKWSGELLKVKNNLNTFTPFLTGNDDIEIIKSADLSNLTDDNATKYKFKLPEINNLKNILEDKNINKIRFNSFNHAVFVFYGFPQFKKELKVVKESKQEKIQKAQEKYIVELQNQKEAIHDRAGTIIENKDFFKSVYKIMTDVYKEKKNWSDFDAEYKAGIASNNEYMKSIKKYDLKNKTATIEFGDECVDFDLSQSLEKNIQKMYEKKKKFADKEIKTKLAMTKVQEKLQPKREYVKKQEREPYWFEKYHFTISENDVLILGGKNAQQNEQIVAKYLEPKDIYFHCEIKGASSIVCKGSSDKNITDATYMSLVMSKSWDNQVMSDVLYVSADQVCKTGPNGENLPKGSFFLHGKRNMSYPHRLEYGFTILFKIKGETNIYKFVNEITEEMEIEHAIPMTGAWSNIKNFKYKARLVPGTERRQKIAQSLIDKFDNESEGRPENKSIRAIGLQEIIDVLPGKCRLAKK